MSDFGLGPERPAPAKVSKEQVAENPWSVLPELHGRDGVAPGERFAAAMGDVGPKEADKSASGGLQAEDSWFADLF